MIENNIYVLVSPKLGLSLKKKQNVTKCYTDDTTLYEHKAASQIKQHSFTVKFIT